MRKNGFKLDFTGLGAPKAGTTWVAKMLNAHPDICLSEPKEINFFNHKSSIFRKEKDQNFVKGTSWYENHFRHFKENQKRGEFSTLYLNDVIAAERIKRLFPDTKLIACLRNPIDRLNSQYNFLKYYLGVENRDFNIAVKTDSKYVDHGLYFKQINEYLKHFDLSSFHFIIFEDIKNQPQKVLHDLYQFLEVEPSFVPDDFLEKKNPSRKSRFSPIVIWIKKITSLLVSMRLIQVIKFSKKLKLDVLVETLLNTKMKYPPLSSDKRKELFPLFEDDINKLEKLLNRDLTYWKE